MATRFEALNTRWRVFRRRPIGGREASKSRASKIAEYPRTASEPLAPVDSMKQVGERYRAHLGWRCSVHLCRSNASSTAFDGTLGVRSRRCTNGCDHAQFEHLQLADSFVGPRILRATSVIHSTLRSFPEPDRLREVWWPGEANDERSKNGDCSRHGIHTPTIAFNRIFPAQKSQASLPESLNRASNAGFASRVRIFFAGDDPRIPSPSNWIEVTA